MKYGATCNVSISRADIIEFVEKKTGEKLPGNVSVAFAYVPPLAAGQAPYHQNTEFSGDAEVLVTWTVDYPEPRA